jgi:hypothetical protein
MIEGRKGNKIYIHAELKKLLSGSSVSECQ